MEWENLLSAERAGGEEESSYKDKKYRRSEFEKDYRKIVSSASFRRLQDKTQVFPLDKSDFVRTRLTHSIETASFAKELGDMAIKAIATKYNNIRPMPECVYSIPDILMCAGLLHDIGNPPFGHFGEVVIGDWFRDNLKNPKYTFNGKTLFECLSREQREDLLHFEGNAQALRLLTKLHFVNNDCGLNLTAAVLNTLVKYPSSSTEIDAEHPDIKFHKMGYFQSDKMVFKDIANKTGVVAGSGIQETFHRHPLTFLLEAADDIAYATADLEDGFKKGMFTLGEFYKFLLDGCDFYFVKNKLGNSYQRKFTKELFDQLHVIRTEKPASIQKGFGNMDLYAIQNWIVYVQNWLTYCSFTGFKQNYSAILQGNYPQELIAGTNHEYSLKILKDAMKHFIFPAKPIVKLELAAKSILESLLERFIQAVIYFDYKAPESLPEDEKKQLSQSKAEKKMIELLSENYIENYRLEVKDISDENEKLYYRLLLVTDYLSGMTDSYAKSLYQELNGMY